MDLTCENGSPTLFKIVLELLSRLCQERVTRNFRISDVSASRMLTASYGFVRLAIINVFMNLYCKMQPLAVKKKKILVLE
jgi:hypothetical protein